MGWGKEEKRVRGAPPVTTALIIRVSVRKQPQRLRTHTLDLVPGQHDDTAFTWLYARLCFVGYSQTVPGVPGYYRKNNFCEFCRALIPERGTSGSSVRRCHPYPELVPGTCGSSVRHPYPCPELSASSVRSSYSYPEICVTPVGLWHNTQGTGIPELCIH